MASGKPEDEIIYIVYYEYDFTMKEIGDFPGVHYSTVSRAVKKHEGTKKMKNRKTRILHCKISPRKEDNLTLRLRLRVKSKMKIGQLEVEPFIAMEPFADTKTDEVSQYRFYARFIFPMGKNVGFVVNYLRQGTRTKNKESINSLNTGFEFKF